MREKKILDDKAPDKLLDPFAMTTPSKDSAEKKMISGGCYKRLCVKIQKFFVFASKRFAFAKICNIILVLEDGFLPAISLDDMLICKNF